MNGASLCNSVLLHSHSRFHSTCSLASSCSSYVYLISPSFTTSTYISVSNRIRQKFRAVTEKRDNGFRLYAVKRRRNGDSGLIESENSIDEDVDEEEDEDWDEFDEGDEEEEGEFLPMDKMKKWLEKKPRGFGEGKKYETSLEDKLLDEIEQSWKAQAANLNKLKNNDPLKPKLKDNNLIKGSGETQGFRVRVTNLPKKKNVHRDLKAAFKEVSGVLNIAPAVLGNKKTKDPVCKGFALLDFKTEVDANRFVEQFNGERLSFGKVIKQIKCQVVEFSSSESVTEERLRSDTVFEELPFSGFEVVANNADVAEELPFSGLEIVSNNADVVEEEDAFADSWEDSDDSDIEVDEAEVEEDEGNVISSSIESPLVELGHVSKTELRSEKQVVKQESTEHEELETTLVPSQVINFEEETVAETQLDDEVDRDDVEEVAEENPEPVNISMSTSEEERIDRIRKLELKLLGREKLSGGGADSVQPKAKSDSSDEVKKKEKKKKKKILVKGQAKKGAKIVIPGSSKRLKVKEQALLTGVLVKYAAKASSSSNDV